MIKKLVVIVLGFWVVKKYVMPYFNDKSDDDFFSSPSESDLTGTTDDTL